MAAVASVIIFVALNFVGYRLVEATQGCSIEKINGSTYIPLRALAVNSTRNGTVPDLFYAELNRTVHIRASREARIGMVSLAGPDSEEFELMYEIILGAGNNTYSSIRRGKTGSLLDKNFTRTLGLLDENEWKGFWIFHNQLEGVIQVATLEDPEYPIVAWVDPQPFRVSSQWHVASWLKNMSLEISVNCNPSVYGEISVEELTSSSSADSIGTSFITVGLMSWVAALMRDRFAAIF